MGICQKLCFCCCRDFFLLIKVIEYKQMQMCQTKKSSKGFLKFFQ